MLKKVYLHVDWEMNSCLDRDCYYVAFIVLSISILIVCSVVLLCCYSFLKFMEYLND